ncbi:nardilysin [Anoplophora glabripennis]|uniref:nardilysin n=1 Tax=Anoplophora glabripennis TaxID=217634 RepID=UPI0008755860|nr:nardilysin [Anoplophora glabripennis]
MKKEAMGREREAIDSEFQMALPSDDMPKEQLLCSLANPNSPVNSFGWGNLKTLRDNISDDKLYEGVHEFRKRHYSAHRMTLAIQARLPMETLQTYVLDCFYNVPNNNLPPEDFSKFGDGIFDTPEFQKMYYIKPNTDLCQLDLTWSLPCLQDKYKTKPHNYVAHLIGDEGKGSLLAYLKQKIWGLATSIGNGETGLEYNSMYCLFTVTIVLTEDGFAHVYEVIEAIFSYINMLKEMGPQARIFDEIKTIADTSFKFSTEENAVDIVEDLCEAMQFYPPEDYIAGSELYYEYSPKDIQTIVDHLNPEKVNIRVLSKTLPNGLKFDKIEPWFGTKYTNIDIPESWIERWKSVKPYPEMDMPPPNPYLTKNFSILPEIENNPEYPKKIISTPLLEMWYRKDQKFKLPLAYYYFYLISPSAIESPKNSAMLDIILNMFVIAITEELYPATAADLSYSFSVHEKGLMIKVSGYNEKLPLVIEVISKYLVTLNDHLTEEMFSAVKDKVVKSYYNKLIKPSTLSKDVRLKLLVSNSWTPVDKHSAIVNVTLEQVKQFYREYMKSLYVKTLVQGNVSAQVASETIDKFVKALQFEQLPENSYPKFKVVQIPNGEKCCRIQGFNKNDANSIITNYYQSGPFSIRNSVIIEIIMLIIEEPLFDILRTKEQLGYSVYCSIRDTFGVLGYTITVNAQATKFTTSYVDERIEAFLKHTKKLLSDISKEQLNQTKGDLIKTKQCADVHLKEEMNRNWSEIVTDDYLFDKLKQEVEAIGDIKIEEIREWWDKHNIFGNQENYKKLSIQVVGNDKNVDQKRAKRDITDSAMSTKYAFNMLGSEEISEKESKAKDYFINDINKFKEGLALYPIVQNFK